MIIHALQTVLHLYNKYSEKVSVYAVIVYIRQIFLIQMKYRLQRMYNHMVIWPGLYPINIKTADPFGPNLICEASRDPKEDLWTIEFSKICL